MTVQEAIKWFSEGGGRRFWFLGTDLQFYNMAEGGHEHGLRNSYYPSWTNKDFRKVIVGVDGSYEP